MAKSLLPKYQYDIISKFEDYLLISITSIDKSMDNAVQLHSWLVFFPHTLQINYLVSS